MGRKSLKELIREAAFELGFLSAGFARAEAVPSERLAEWFRRGYHGKMSYLERNAGKRLDPRLVMDGVKTLVSVTMGYFVPGQLPYEDPRTGVVSRYAAGEDYHEVLWDRLMTLCGKIDEWEPGSRSRFYVDTGPVMDKHWAVQAGLGWIGKHTNLIERRHGSWLFVGEILTSVEVEPDCPTADYCGSCTRCIEACPTDAIVEPYVLDSRRCISYLTIELRDEVPVELRPRMGNLIFGCDICQEVCPWNRKASPASIPEFRDSRKEETDLVELSRLTPEEFSRRFRGSPIKRAKWRGLIRNVIIAMGNGKCREFIPELARLAESEDDLIRQHAVWALDRMDG